MRTLEPTWSVLDREPGMDDLAEGASGVLQELGEDLGIYPFQDTERNDRLFLSRFEFPKYGEDRQFPAAVADGSSGFLDFLAGFPIDCVEMLVAIGEFSSKAKEGEDSKVIVMEGTGVSAPIPTGNLFQWPEDSKVLLNLTAIPTPNVGQFLAPNLTGEPKPASPKWWFRVQLTEAMGSDFPVPGEFLGLGIRMWPGKFWGHQKSSPFIYSGNWMDTIFYTSARITEVIEPTDDVPYSTYKVKWHGKDDEFTVNPSDFAEYQVGDRVTILKDVATEKTSQLWKDDDMQAFNEAGNWVIAPITFYGLESEGE